MKIGKIFFSSIAILYTLLTSGCFSSGGSSQLSTPQPLPLTSINLIFVTSPDLAYNTSGDIQNDTANLTPQGLNRSLQLASYLQKYVLGNQNVTQIYALQPVSHIQNGYPDMAGIEFIQQFAMQNQVTLQASSTQTQITAYGYPINTSYSKNGLPVESVATPPSSIGFLQNIAGLSFNDANSSNEIITTSIINNKQAGYYVFSAPWETVSSLLGNINTKYGYGLNIPTKFIGSNTIYAITINTNNTSSAQLSIFNSDIKPSTSYPSLPQQISTNNPCQAAQFSYSTSNPINANINKNQTVYFVRHAEAHPNNSNWDDGNYIAAGQWRALLLPAALQNKITPSMVVSVDPAQGIGGSVGANGNTYSYVRPSLTVQPYAIANNMPYILASSVYWNNPKGAIDYLFYNPQFNGKTILVAWEHDNIADIMQTFLTNGYFSNQSNSSPKWGGSDYDSIWSVNLDSNGNLNFSNSLCEGINSSTLPNTAPLF